MGAAITKALDMVEERKREYRAKWYFVLSPVDFPDYRWCTNR